MTNAEWAAVALVAAALTVAIATDLRYRRIPNKLVLAGLIASFVLHGWAVLAGARSLSGDRIFDPLLGILVGGGLLMILYLLRACGAGDVKLMAMVGAFTGPTTAAHAVLYTMLAGGVLSLVFMLGRGVARQTLENVKFVLVEWIVRLRGGEAGPLAPLATTAARLPYGVAIAAGTAIALWQRLA